MVGSVCPHIILIGGIQKVPSKSKAKGNRFEREVVKLAKEYGLESKRAWGSDGRSLGLHPEVDITIEEELDLAGFKQRI